MLEVVLLESLVPQRQVLVMQEVVRHVVENVTEDAAAVDGGGGMPRVEEDSMGEVPEGVGKDDEERRGHDEAVAIHREVVVDAVEEEMEGDEVAVVR